MLDEVWPTPAPDFPLFSGTCITVLPCGGGPCVNNDNPPRIKIIYQAQPYFAHHSLNFSGASLRCTTFSVSRGYISGTTLLHPPLPDFPGRFSSLYHLFRKPRLVVQTLKLQRADAQAIANPQFLLRLYSCTSLILSQSSSPVPCLYFDYVTIGLDTEVGVSRGVSKRESEAEEIAVTAMKTNSHRWIVL